MSVFFAYVVYWYSLAFAGAFLVYTLIVPTNLVSHAPYARGLALGLGVIVSAAIWGVGHAGFYFLINE